MDDVSVAYIATIAGTLRVILLNQMLKVRDAGYQVVGISSPQDPQDVQALTERGIEHIPVPITRRMTPVQDLRSLWALFQVMRRGKYTIAHTNTPKPGLLGQIAARCAGVPIVVNTVHGFYFHENTPPSRRFFYITIEKLAALFSDRIFTVSEEDAATAVRVGIAPADRVVHLGGGIDVQRFDPAAIDPQVVARKRQEMGLPPTGPVVGFVARLQREKGILELLQAARIVREHIPDVRFLIVGPVHHEKADTVTPEIASEYGLADICCFPGGRTDMPDLYAMMDVFALPSHREGLPRTPMEASAMRVPSVVTNVRGCREVVRHNHNGLIVPLGDVEALAAALIHVLTEPDEAGRMGEEGRRIALERFDERRIEDRVLTEYADLLERKGLRAPQFAVSGVDGPDGARTSTRRKPYHGLYRALGKRSLDLALTAPAVAALLPVYAALGVAVRARLGASVLFRQERTGLHGESFLLTKYRTMIEAYDASGRPLPDAERLTPFGRFLRATSLDELPELFAVLRGDMSLVGPRPLPVRYVPRYSPEHLRRHAVKPGITGLAQISGRNAISWQQKFDLDVQYVEDVSPGLDIRIIALTLLKLISREGISAPGEATMEEFWGLKS